MSETNEAGAARLAAFQNEIAVVKQAKAGKDGTLELVRENDLTMEQRQMWVDYKTLLLELGALPLGDTERLNGLSQRVWGLVQSVKDATGGGKSSSAGDWQFYAWMNNRLGVLTANLETLLEVADDLSRERGEYVK